MLFLSYLVMVIKYTVTKSMIFYMDLVMVIEK